VLHIPDLQRALHDLQPHRALPRRAVLASLAGILPAWALPDSLAVEAKKHKHKHKHKNKKKNNTPQTNAFGCLNIGQHCNGKDDKCCSGICDGKKPKKGKKDKSKCAGHDANICQPGFDVCQGVIATCSNGGACFTTTGNAPFCAGGDGVCTVCRRDPDCVAAGFGALAACVVCNSECPETGGTVCFSAG
jgi:hypothetical protein